MSMGFFGEKIHCPNCRFEGGAKTRHARGWEYGLVTALFALSLLFLPLAIVPAAYLVQILCRSGQNLCPKCGWEHPVPLAQHRKTTRRPA